MKPVRIYISILYKEEWEHSVFRDIKTLRESWNETYSNSDWELCIIHVGYDRPDYDHEMLVELLAIQRKPVFLTESAKWSLPAIHSNCSFAVVATCQLSGKSENMNLYIALDGWGYQIAESSVPGFKALVSRIVRVKEGWVEDLCKKSSHINEIFDSIDIYNEASYFEHKHLIQDKIRNEAGNFRFEYLKRQSHISDPFDLVAICPDWLLNYPVTRLELTVRLKNVFSNQNIFYVSDLKNYTSVEFMHIPNFGRKSLTDLEEALLSTYTKYAANPEMLTDGAKEILLHDHLQRALAALPDNPRRIITARLGADGNSPLTLQTLGDMFGITRERIRQIEKKYLNNIIERESWDDLIYKKISGLLNRRQDPLYLDMLSAEDSWFSGFENKFEFLKEVITRFSEDKIKSIKYDGREILTTIEQASFDLLLKMVRTFIQKNINSDFTRELLEEIIKTECLGHGVPYLKSIVKDAVSENLHYALVEGREILVGIGRGVDNLVSIILEEAEKPLHYSEIWKRVNALSEVEIDVRRVHSCLTANNDAMLFDRGTYGLKRHLKISQAIKDEILADVEEIISNGPEQKQWHVSELLEILIEESYPHADEINNYELGIILEESGNLISLGKQVWTQKHRENISTNDRIQTMNAIMTIMEDAGKPLKTNELLERVSRYRGIKSKMQINPNETLIKLESNLWGLVHRDLPFSMEEKDIYLDAIFNHIDRTIQSIHISEIPEILISSGTRYPLDSNPFVFLSLCSADERFKTWQGHLIGLRNWGLPGRDNIASAFRKVLPTINRPTSTAEVQAQMQQVLGRPITKSKVSGLLSNSPAIYDKEMERWTNPENADSSTFALQKTA